MSALDDARAALDYSFGHLDGSGTTNECIGLPLDAAARAVLALAEEQRTANLIALLASEGAWNAVGHANQRELTMRITQRLGLPA